MRVHWPQVLVPLGGQQPYLKHSEARYLISSIRRPDHAIAAAFAQEASTLLRQPWEEPALSVNHHIVKGHSEYCRSCYPVPDSHWNFRRPCLGITTGSQSQLAHGLMPSNSIALLLEWEVEPITAQTVAALVRIIRMYSKIRLSICEEWLPSQTIWWCCVGRCETNASNLR